MNPDLGARVASTGCVNTSRIDAGAYRALFDATTDAVAVLDGRRRLLAGNAAFADLLGERWEALFERDPEFFEQGFARAREGLTHRAEVIASAADGTLRTFCAATIPFGEGRRRGVLLVLRDAGEPAQSRERWRAFFEHGPAVAIAVSAQGHITDVNAAGLRVTGYTREQILGRHIVDFVPEQERPVVLDALARGLAGESVSFQTTAIDANGDPIGYEGVAFPARSCGEIVGVYGLLQNVTARRQAERILADQAEELVERERDFRSLFEYNPNAILWFDRAGTIHDANDAAEHLGGYPREAIVGQNFRSVFEKIEAQRVWKHVARALTGEPVSFETYSVAPDGVRIELDATLVPKFSHGAVTGAYAMLRDTSERRRAERRAERQGARIRDLYSIAAAAEYSETHLLTALQIGCRLLEMETGAIVEMDGEPHLQTRYDVEGPTQYGEEQLLALAREIAATRRAVVRARIPGERQAYRCCLGMRLTTGGVVHGVLLFTSRGARRTIEQTDRELLALMAALLAGVQERRRIRARLRTLAYFDPLTGLPNRLYFQERLRDAIAQAQRGKSSPAVLFFDLDRFRDVNDTLGHPLGDRLLQQVALRLVAAAGPDATVARMGGDEFSVLLAKLQPERRSEQARAAAESLLRAIDQPYRLDAYEQYVTSSAGVALYPQHGRDDQALLKHADIAMYDAKDAGRNGYRFYEAAREATLHSRLTQEKRLRTALEEGQFVVHYQPMIDMRSGAVRGVEALVRWNHPEQGLVAPDTFIPQAEASGLIVPLGAWVLRTGAQQIAPGASASARSTWP